MYGFHSNFTSCIRSESRNAIRAAIISLFEQEHGCYLLSEIPRPPFNKQGIKHLKIAQRPPLLIIGLGIGREGWTIIKTYPNDWFFLRTPSKERPRLSALAMRLQCDAFHYRVLKDVESLLVEADSNGKFRFDSTKMPDFSLLNVSQTIQKAIMVKNYPEIIRKEKVFRTEYRKQKELGVFDRHLLSNMSEGLEENAEQIDNALANIIDPFQSYWYINDLFEQAYTNSEKLKHMNVKLLYFNPPENYLNTLPSYRDRD